MRLDQAIAARFPDVSRRKARELIAAGRVLVNGRPVRIASREIAGDAQITIASEDVPALPVIASTDEWIAVDKPAGMPSQPTRDRATLSAEEILRIEHRQIFLVHRLDTPASGVMLFARTRGAAANLSELFAAGAMRKTYLARVEGRVERASHIDTPIDGKAARTEIEPMGGLVLVRITTGRTHQIRRHLASIGHPILGDTRYGGAPAERLMLHAWKLEHSSIGILEAPPPIHFAV
jgi:23S rRNA-/tRNA-specific pseudouridylate synthase